jgi:hypothetical protein
MTIQRFKTIIAKSGTRTFIPLPFNPNDVWGIKQRHHIRGSVNGHSVRGSLGSDGTIYFLPLGTAWRRGCGLEAGAEVEVVLSPEGRSLKVFRLMSSMHWMPSHRPKPSLSRWLPFIETPTSSGSRVPNALRRVQHASTR